MVKQLLLTGAQPFEKARFEEVNKDKMCRILRILGSVKNVLSNQSNQVKYSEASELDQKYWKIDFSKVIFTDES